MILILRHIRKPLRFKIMESTELEELFDEIENVHYPPGRSFQRIQRYKASKRLEDNELEGIYHLVESHTPGLRSKAVLRYEKCISFPNNTTSLSLSKDYIAFNCNRLPCERNIQCMLHALQDMPEEWTIVQLTPQFNSEENLESNVITHYTNPLHISVFNCGKDQITPFCLPVGAPKDNVSGHIVGLVDEMHSIINLNKQVLSHPKMKPHFKNRFEKENYYSKRQSIDDRLKNIVKDLQDLWLKEWRCLLMGKYINRSIEVKIMTHITEFLNKEVPSLQLSEKTKYLLLYLVKGSYYLKPTELKRAVQFCFPKSEKAFQKSLVSFIRHLCDTLFLVNEKRYPLILVIDDTLDCFPWEMMDILLEEPVSRVPSLHFVYALYKQHESEIENGFKVIKDYEKGTYIVNPDLDLKNMEVRISKFLNYWLPSWKGIINKKPTELEFEEMLTSANIFSYHGHGAGTQFFSMDKIQKIHVKAVVLLFGCGSTKLCEISPQVEMYGAYQMYLIACSPCVVGMLWEVTDVDTDSLTTEFMSQWLPSDADIHWKYVDKEKWSDKDEVKFTKSKIIVNNPNGRSCYEPELLKALSIAKKSCSFYVTKAACVARGIPVKINV